MERNQVTVATILATALIAAVSLGILMRGSTPQTDAPEPVPVTVSPEPKAKKKAKAKTYAEADYTELEPGLKILDVDPGDGGMPVEGAVVDIKVAIWLDGKKLRAADKEKFVVGDGKALPVYDKVVRTMKPGGIRRALVGPEHAYGHRGKPPLIPPSANLTMEIRLVKVAAPRPGSPDKPQTVDGHTKTDSGLMFHDFEIGSGPECKAGDKIVIDYTGWLPNLKKFDSSLDRIEPLAIRIGKGDVLKGWDEGIVGMRVGGKRQLVLPPELGYGKKGLPPTIPRNSSLIFEIELKDIQ